MRLPILGNPSHWAKESVPVPWALACPHPVQAGSDPERARGRVHPGSGTPCREMVGASYAGYYLPGIDTLLGNAGGFTIDACANRENLKMCVMFRCSS